MPEADEGGHKQLAPPYTSYQSLKTLAAGFKEHGLPGRVDRSVLSNFSGAVATQIITALRFLSLIDAQGHPTEAMGDLVASFGSDEWPHQVTRVLRHAYHPLFQLNLETASPAQFTDAFRRAYSAEGDTLRKCVTFFLNAAQDAQIPVSAYILKNKKPRGNNSPKRSVSSSRKKATPPPGSTAEEQERQLDRKENEKQSIPAATPEMVLVDMLKPNDMTPEEQQAVFTLLVYLKRQAAPQGSNA